MNQLIFYYSFSGTTKKIAEELAKKESAIKIKGSMLESFEDIKV